MANPRHLRQLCSQVCVQFVLAEFWRRVICLFVLYIIFYYFALVVNQGDEVILFDPAYETYDTCIKLAGGVPVSFSDIR